MKNFVLACFGVTVALALPAAAESVPPGHFRPNELPQGILESFIDAVTEDQEWTVTEEQAGAPKAMTAEQRFVWAGSEIKAEIQIGTPVVTFTRNATNLVPANSFTLDVGFERLRMVLLSSAPGEAKLVHGVALEYSEKQPFKRFIPGAGDTGFVTLIPKQSNDDWYGIAICPRNRVDTKSSHTLLSTGYSAVSVKVPVEGELSAKQRTGYSKGKIYGEVLTSANIRRASPFEREVFSESPTLQIQYFADSTDTAAESTTLPYGGIVMHGAMVAPQGAKRSKRIEAFVRTVPFTPVKPIPFIQDGHDYLIDAGECHAIIRGVFFEENFIDK